MESLRQGPSHPLALAALFALLANDHVVRVRWPSVVTGKVSDVAWLVVAPVVVAAVLARCGAREGVAKGAAIGGVAFVYTLLQVWAPLGDTWVALTGGRHVADLEDLLCLPALLLVPLVWRGAPRPERRTAFALPIASFACLATSYINCEPTRLPVDGEGAWDPSAPLGVGFGLFGWSPHDTAGVLSSVTLTTAAGDIVPFVATTVGQTTWLCPIGGLLPDTDYVWRVDAMGTNSPNHLQPDQPETGTTTFHTAATAAFEPVTNELGCERLVAEVNVGLLCRDTADTGDVLDTSDTADTGADTP